jgi:hypothetical protein
VTADLTVLHCLRGRDGRMHSSGRFLYIYYDLFQVIDRDGDNMMTIHKFIPIFNWAEPVFPPVMLTLPVCEETSSSSKQAAGSHSFETVLFGLDCVLRDQHQLEACDLVCS